MLVLRIAVVVCVLTSAVLAAGDGEARTLARQARKAEHAGQVVQAYLLYSQAAALDPKKAEYWTRSQALRTRAVTKARVMPVVAAPLPKTPTEKAGALREALPTIESSLSEQDMTDLRRLKAPPRLKGREGQKSLVLRGNAKSIFEQAAKAFGLETIFDGDYPAGPPITLETADSDWRETLKILESATGSFIVPLSDRLFLVAKDTPQKRIEVEPTVAVTIPIPNTISPQEAQEMARSVQQAMELTRFSVDPVRQLVFMKDRISKVRPAEKLFEQLVRLRSQVEIEIEMVEVNRSAVVSYGLLLPSQFPIYYLGGILHSSPGISGTIARLITFGGGKTLFGFGITDPQLFLRMTGSNGRSLMKAEVRSLDGQPASFHVGDKYPIMTGGFLGGSTGVAYGYGLPQFNFEDLGLVLKVTPHVHGTEEVSLDLETEFKVLAGQSLNGIPVIANRKLQSKVRLRDGEWAAVAGLMSTSEARSISGIWGLSTLPVLGRLFRQNDTTTTETQALILIKPKLISLPPSAEPTQTVYLGSEGRLQIPR